MTFCLEDSLKKKIKIFREPLNNPFVRLVYDYLFSVSEKKGPEDSSSELSSDGSSNRLFSSFIQIHSDVSNFYKSNHSHIKTVSLSLSLCLSL